MRVDVIGSSGTFPTANNPASGYLITQGETRVWCDTGPGTYTRLPVDSRLIDAVFISHRHPDHCSDLFTAFHAWTYVPEPREQIKIYANGDVLDHLAGFMGHAREDAFGETFHLTEVGHGAVTAVGELEIAFFDVAHSVPALGTRWRGGGRTLFYTGDTGPGEWGEFAHGANLLLSEAALQGERQTADFDGHLTALEAGQIARDQRVDRLVLTHIPPYMDVTVSVAEAESTFGRPVALATSGANFKV